MSGAATRRQATSNRKKFCKQCPVCAKQNVSSRLRRFQVNWDDYVTLCENEQCLYPLVTADDEDNTGKNSVENVDLSNKMDNCPSATQTMSNGQTLDDVDCRSSPGDASSAAHEMPDFLAALQNFFMDDVDESVTGVGCSHVPPQVADPLDSSDILHRLMIFGDDASADNDDQLDSLVAMLNNVTSEPPNHEVQRPQSVSRDDQDFASSAISSPTATVTDLDSRASTPDRVIRRDVSAKKQIVNEMKSIETRVPIEPTSKRTAAARSLEKSIVKQPEHRTSSVITTKSATTSSSSNKTRTSSGKSACDLNFLNIFQKHKHQPRKRSATCNRTVVALTTSKEAINKNKLVTTWLSKSDLAAQVHVPKKNTFSGFQSYSSARNQNQNQSQKDDGTPSEDSGIQSPLSLRSTDSDSMAIR